MLKIWSERRGKNRCVVEIEHEIAEREEKKQSEPKERATNQDRSFEQVPRSSREREQIGGFYFHAAFFAPRDSRDRSNHSSFVIPSSNFVHPKKLFK